MPSRGRAAGHAAWRAFALTVAGLGLLTLVARLVALAIEPGAEGNPFATALGAVLYGVIPGGLHAATQALAVVYAERRSRHDAGSFRMTGRAGAASLDRCSGRSARPSTTGSPAGRR